MRNRWPTIIVKYSDLAGQWVAHFDGSPQVAFGSDLPMVAVRRLLIGNESPADRYELRCDQDQVGSGVLTYEALWKPPELLFLCERCNGKGEYTGLMEVEKCQPCGGRGWLVG